eukprot:gene9292-1380_t
MKLVAVIVFLTFVCASLAMPTSSASSTVPTIEPPKWCGDNEQGRPICVEYQKVSFKCYLQKTNGDVFDSKEIELNEDLGATVLAATAPTAPSTDQMNFNFVNQFVTVRSNGLTLLESRLAPFSSNYKTTLTCRNAGAIATRTLSKRRTNAGCILKQPEVFPFRFQPTQYSPRVPINHAIQKPSSMVSFGKSKRKPKRKRQFTKTRSGRSIVRTLEYIDFE